MIKFFRTIRQKMITEGKFSKYILYAIGEIVLVVIGILIALSINNWNEKRKDNILKQTFLLKLKSNLQDDISKFKEVGVLIKSNIRTLSIHHTAGKECFLIASIQLKYMENL